MNNKEDILIILYEEKDKNGRNRIIVSHGVNVETLENVVLPQVPLECIGKKEWSNVYNGWLLH